jgi:hypothetical protein
LKEKLYEATRELSAAKEKLADRKKKIQELLDEREHGTLTQGTHRFLLFFRSSAHLYLFISSQRQRRARLSLHGVQSLSCAIKSMRSKSNWQRRSDGIFRSLSLACCFMNLTRFRNCQVSPGRATSQA